MSDEPYVIGVGYSEGCGPEVCDYPHPSEWHRGDLWTCSNCGSRYRLTRPYKRRRWRNWEAPYGYWKEVRR